MITAEDALKSFRAVMGTLPWWVSFESEGHDVNTVLRFIKEHLPEDHKDYIASDRDNAKIEARSG